MENFRLTVFCSVAQHLNFSRVAEQLLLTQPAVTKQIKALEEEFGIPLFDRSGGHIRLTKYGSALLPPTLPSPSFRTGRSGLPTQLGNIYSRT